MIAAFGLTPRRYAWLRRKLGLDEVLENSCSGCEGRKRWLNTFGGRLATSPHWAAKLLTRLLVRSHLPPKSE